MNRDVIAADNSVFADGFGPPWAGSSIKLNGIETKIRRDDIPGHWLRFSPNQPPRIHSIGELTKEPIFPSLRLNLFKKKTSRFSWEN
ncbi:hypothetical protein KJ940_02370 [Myxococcota bacterium]|nr:hypothetical protein [Myxococcota bacterium]